MSHYITKWCAEHGEWDEDVDNAFNECPDCEREGKLDRQKKDACIAALEADLTSERERAKKAEHAAAQFKDALEGANEELGRIEDRLDATERLLGEAEEAIRRAEALLSWRIPRTPNGTVDWLTQGSVRRALGQAEGEEREP